ncbi:metal-dependent hydrolase [Mycolicibacter heraklionensis]|uniref:Metal-dependent hydrolase n=1 Tax=Mycolicibacter heraklionensis TaxID=512402 RepID=A0AA91IWP1_9MYCO|nr:metal-dependent hydrolase [Mycolicibacter heraklionensis]OBK82456.1 metal-dependent hydrolase [Mycolicibacter heraklionensis]
MSNLTVRRVRFDLAGDDIPFNWQPERPAFSMHNNVVSFFAPGFEKLIVDATREAMPLIADPAVADEANDFLRQEAQHSAAHVRHINALCRRWPGLQETMDQVVASYDRLTATKPLVWRLAYTAVVENTFTPYFKVFLDHEDLLFEPGDERVASLFLWHFVEEIEHRSSALTIYNAIHPSYSYRLRAIPGVVKHLGEIVAIIRNGFLAHVPAEEGGEFARLLPDGLSLAAIRAQMKDARRLQRPGQGIYAGVSRRELIGMIIGLIRSQGPGHDPAHEKLPAFAGKWFRRYGEEPKSAARWYSVGAQA